MMRPRPQVWRRNAVRGLRQLLAPMRSLPDFLIIGARKSGTTSLYNYLAAHPDVVPAMRKEIYYFDRHFQKGLNWYRAHFPLRRGRRDSGGAGGGWITGEATPGYLFSREVAERVRATTPRIRLIVVLRNPVDRALSEYHLVVRNGNESLGFEAALDREEEWLLRKRAEQGQPWGPVRLDRSCQPYLTKGVYVDWLQAWMDVFPREQFCILEAEQFFARPAAELQPVFGFLGLPGFTSDGYPQHVRGSYSRMDAATRGRLETYYAPHNARLYNFLGRRFGWDA